MSYLNIYDGYREDHDNDCESHDDSFDQSQWDHDHNQGEFIPSVLSVIWEYIQIFYQNYIPDKISDRDCWNSIGICIYRMARCDTPPSESDWKDFMSQKFDDQNQCKQLNSFQNNCENKKMQSIHEVFQNIIKYIPQDLSNQVKENPVILIQWLGKRIVQLFSYQIKLQSLNEGRFYDSLPENHSKNVSSSSTKKLFLLWKKSFVFPSSLLSQSTMEFIFDYVWCNISCEICCQNEDLWQNLENELDLGMNDVNDDINNNVNENIKFFETSFQEYLKIPIEIILLWVSHTMFLNRLQIWKELHEYQKLNWIEFKPNCKRYIYFKSRIYQQHSEQKFVILNKQSLKRKL